jgi:hypothetical protein
LKAVEAQGQKIGTAVGGQRPNYKKLNDTTFSDRDQNMQNMFHPPKQLNPLSSQADSFAMMSNSMIQSPTEIIQKARRIKNRGHISIDEDN